MTVFRVSDDDIAAFTRDGYFVAPSLLDGDEVRLLGDIARADRQMSEDAYGRTDGEGGTVKLLIQNEPGTDDIYGAVARSERIVRTMDRLLGDEVYHYHNKMILKEPLVGGAWEWHQDYGYWYDNGCLLPDMASCLIAVDRATRENGCLQVLAGSHRMGRVNHVRIGDQTGADPERVAAARERFELVHCELQPGDAVFFHANLLHRSDQNRSEHPRWAFICCYNARRNDPYKESRHPRYTSLDVWPDERIQLIGQSHWQRMQQSAT